MLHWIVTSSCYLLDLKEADARPLDGARGLIERLVATTLACLALGIVSGNLEGLTVPKLEAVGIPASSFVYAHAEATTPTETSFRLSQSKGPKGLSDRISCRMRSRSLAVPRWTSCARDILEQCQLLLQRGTLRTNSSKHRVRPTY